MSISFTLPITTESYATCIAFVKRPNYNSSQMPNRLYVFIDESGDAGDVLCDGASSTYYAELALQINNEGLSDLLAHITSWRYILGKHHEAKSLPSDKFSLDKFIKPIIALNNRGDLCCSCVYLIKSNYTGPYLRANSPRGQNHILFRNYIHRQLLEYHFKVFPTQSQNIELVFDRYRMNREAINNLNEYLLDNWNLPEFEYICHVDSLYTEPIQLASQLVNSIKDIVVGTADKERRNFLSFIALKDITRI